MIAWIVLVILLGLFQISYLLLGFPQTYVYVFSVLMLLLALGISYRVYRKEKSGKIEEMEEELKSLREAIEASIDRPKSEGEVIENEEKK